MTKLKITLLFISLVVLRFCTVSSPLPSEWSSQTKIAVETTIWSPAEYSDTQTLLRSGIWEFRFSGYQVVIPGSRVRMVGVVTPTYGLGKVTKLVMKAPVVEVLSVKHDNLWLALMRLRDSWVATLEKTLPEPMASLAIGILLGGRRSMPSEFYQMLVNTGTLHIIAASGYNVMIMAQVLMNIVRKIWRRGSAIVIGLGGIWGYVIVAGCGAAVVRAGVMASLTMGSYYYGRPVEAKRILWISLWVMLLYNPLWILDIGFELSAAATIGLMYLGQLMSKWLPRQAFLSEYLYPTLAASLATLPVILYYFGRVSWISPLANILILPVVPLVMVVSGLVIGLGMLSLSYAQLVSWLCYVPLYYIVQVVRILG